MRQRPTIDSFRLDTTGWNRVVSKRRTRTWLLDTGDVVVLLFCRGRSIYCDLEDPKGLQDIALGLASKVKAGVVEVGSTEINGRPSFRMITKAKEGSGWSYAGWIIVPFRRCSYWVRPGCEEGGMTGYRESIVFDRLLRSGEVTWGEKTGSFEADGVEIETVAPSGWFLEEPVSPAPELRKNRSEDPVYDSEFPEHPLSRARSLLSHIEQTARLDELLRSQPLLETKVKRRLFRVTK